MSGLKVKPRAADVARAKGYVDRVKALIEQQKELGADISDVCTEAKQNAGLDPTTIRFAARELLMDAEKRRERDEKREQYLHAVGLAAAAVEGGHLSLREAERKYGVAKSAIHRAISVPYCPCPEMTDGDLGHFEPVREMVAEDLGDPLLIVNPFRARVKAIAAGVHRRENIVAIDPKPMPKADAGPIPPFLDRRRTREAAT